MWLRLQRLTARTSPSKALPVTRQAKESRRRKRTSLRKSQNRWECNFLKEKVLEALENPVKREFSRAFLRSIFDFYDVIENKRLETEEKQYYDCCGAVTVGQEPHEWQDGKCAARGYGCTDSRETGSA